MRLTFLALLLLIASVGFFACGDDDDSGTEPTQPESTTQAADEPTPRETGDAPTPTETGDAPTATASPTLADSSLEYLRQLADEGMELCASSDVVARCTEAYVAAATSGSPEALCVSESAGTWFMETPGEGVAVGDACATDATHTVVALLNY